MVDGKITRAEFGRCGTLNKSIGLTLYFNTTDDKYYGDTLSIENEINISALKLLLRQADIMFISELKGREVELNIVDGCIEEWKLKKI